MIPFRLHRRIPLVCAARSFNAIKRCVKRPRRLSTPDTRGALSRPFYGPSCFACAPSSRRCFHW